MENVKNRINLHLTDNEDNAIKWFSKINFKTSKSDWIIATLLFLLPLALEPKWRQNQKFSESIMKLRVRVHPSWTVG